MFKVNAAAGGGMEGNMKVVMVNPSGYRASYESFTPLGLLSLATVVHNQACDIEMEVIDMFKEHALRKQDYNRSVEVNIEEDVHCILERKPDVVGIYAMFNTLLTILLLAQRIRELEPGVKIMLGGPQASVAADAILKNCPYIDAVGLGEGETTIIDICRAVVKNDFSNVMGVAYRNQDEVICRYANSLIEDLDTLSMIDLDLYSYPISDMLSLDVGRGCPFSCNFCSTKLFWKQKYRIKSPKRIFEEIKFYHEKYGIKQFPIVHDLFTLNKEAVKEFCDLMIENKLDVTWTCSSRIDTVDEILLRKMSEAHCVNIFFGVESGSARIQKVIHKNLDLQKIPGLYKLCKEIGMGTTFAFVYSFPQETRNDISDTFNLMYQIWDMGYEEFKKKKLSVRLSRLIFLSGTELTTEFMDQLVLIEDKVKGAYGEFDNYYKNRMESLINNKEMFPHYYHMPTKLSEELQYLDQYVDIIMEHGLLKYFDVTYKLLLSEAAMDNLEVFYMLKNVINDDIIQKLVTYYNSSYVDFMNYLISLLDIFIKTHPFQKIDLSLLQSIFQYEKDIYNELYLSKEDQVDVIKSYDYNVFIMKKYRMTDTMKEKCLVNLKKNGRKVSMSRKKNFDYALAD